MSVRSRSRKFRSSPATYEWRAFALTSTTRRYEIFAIPPPRHRFAADERGRSAQTFLVDVVVRNGSGIRRAIAQGRDIYAFTAPLVVEAVERILDGQARGSGVLAPGETFDSTDFLRALTPEYLTFEPDTD